MNNTKISCPAYAWGMGFLGAVVAFLLFPGLILSIPSVNGKYISTGVVTWQSAFVHAFLILLILVLIYYLVLKSSGICAVKKA